MRPCRLLSPLSTWPAPSETRTRGETVCHSPRLWPCVQSLSLVPRPHARSQLRMDYITAMYSPTLQSCNTKFKPHHISCWWRIQDLMTGGGEGQWGGYERGKFFKVTNTHVHGSSFPSTSLLVTQEKISYSQPGFCTTIPG